jgi:hypothetical protein
MPQKIHLITDDSHFTGSTSEWDLDTSKRGRAVGELDLNDMNREVQRFARQLVAERRLIVYDVIEHVKDMLDVINQQTS